MTIGLTIYLLCQYFQMISYAGVLLLSLNGILSKTKQMDKRIFLANGIFALILFVNKLLTSFLPIDIFANMFLMTPSSITWFVFHFINFIKKS